MTMPPLLCGPTATAALVGCILANVACAQPSARDFRFPEPKSGLPAASERASGKTKASPLGKGLAVLSGGDLSEALADATHPPAMGSGGWECAAVATASGELAFAGVGRARFDPKAPREDRLRGMRNACFDARVAALVRLAEALEGVEIERLVKTESRFKTLLKASAAGETTESERTRVSKDAWKRSVRSLLRGVVVHRADVNPERGEVTIWVAVTDRLAASRQNASPEIGLATDPTQGVQAFLDQAYRGFLPLGCGQRIVTISGEVLWVAYGGSILPEGRNAAERELAEREARFTAQQALVSTLEGARIESVTTARESAARYRKILEGGEGLPPQVRQSLDQLRETESRQAVAVKGSVPAGLKFKTFTSPDANWLYCVAVYRPASSARAKQIAEALNRALRGR